MLDSRQKRAAVVGVARAWYRNSHPSSLNAAQRASISQVYPVAIFSGVSAPVFSGTIPSVTVEFESGTHQYDYSTYFTGATSYSIAPSVETGWTFNASTGVLTIDTDDTGTFGSYVITGTNTGGSANSNSFTIKVNEESGSSGGFYKRKKTHHTLSSLEDYEELAKKLIKEEKEEEQKLKKLESKLKDKQITVLLNKDPDLDKVKADQKIVKTQIQIIEVKSKIIKSQQILDRIQSELDEAARLASILKDDEDFLRHYLKVS